MADVSVSTHRLGKRQLGRHAFEEHMPGRVHDIASQEKESNHLSGVIPVLAKLLNQDTRVSKAYLCHDSVEHIYRTKGEGHHFCGYRNIQMMLSFGDSQKKDHHRLRRRQYSSIIELQDFIEGAWAAGFNSNGLVETGGIKDTRKHIGTLEAQALFRHLGIAGPAQSFPNNVKGDKFAYKDLINLVEDYFSPNDSEAEDKEEKVHCIPRAPIYLQRPRHSLTIVGIERRKDGSSSLLVFDPGYRPPWDLQRALAKGASVEHPKAVLKAYRRNERYLKRYRAYETLQISGS